MKRLSRYCTTGKQADRYQWRLYDRYDYVRLVSWPRFSEDGLYVWEVRK